MTTIVCDASSLILLSKSGLLKAVVKRNKIIIPKKVYEEIIKGKDKGRRDAFVIEKLVTEKKIKIKKLDEKEKNEIKKMFNMHGGENETLTLANKSNNTVLTDDKKCINAAKALGIDFITSLDVVITLYKKKVIDRKETQERLDGLSEYGWYKKNVIEKYRRMIT